MTASSVVPDLEHSGAYSPARICFLIARYPRLREVATANVLIVAHPQAKWEIAMNLHRIPKSLAALSLVIGLAALMVAGAQPASSLNKKCTDKLGTLVCKIGDRGPGGGIVIYDAGSAQPWGRYLEVAPANWNRGKDDYVWWCPTGATGDEYELQTQDGIGAGAANTRIAIDACGTDTAAGMAAAYRGGKKSDWHLPSKDELQVIWDYRGRARLGMTSNYYWSSSQFVPASGGDLGAVWTTYFGDGSQQEGSKDGSDNRVRPIRAFK